MDADFIESDCFTRGKFAWHSWRSKKYPYWVIRSTDKIRFLVFRGQGTLETEFTNLDEAKKFIRLVRLVPVR